MTLVAVSIFW